MGRGGGLLGRQEKKDSLETLTCSSLCNKSLIRCKIVNYPWIIQWLIRLMWPMFEHLPQNQSKAYVLYWSSIDVFVIRSVLWWEKRLFYDFRNNSILVELQHLSVLLTFKSKKNFTGDHQSGLILQSDYRTSAGRKRRSQPIARSRDWNYLAEWKSDPWRAGARNPSRAQDLMALKILAFIF